MKEKDTSEEEVEVGNQMKRNDLLEPLVEDSNSKYPNKESNSNNLIKNANITNNDNNDTPFQFLHNSINVNNLKYNSTNPISRIRREISDFNKENETQNSNYSNTPGTQALKFQNFLYIVVVVAFSSLQFGIFLFVFNLYMKAMNNPINNIQGNNKNNAIITTISSKGLFYSFLLVLSWKYQIYLIIYLAYAAYVYFKIKNKTKKEESINNYQNFTEDSMPFINRSNSISSQTSFINSFGGNPTFKFREFKYKYLQKYGYTYDSYYNVFLLTSNIFDTQENFKEIIKYYFNIKDLLKGISGILFAYSILVSSYFYYFGITYIIQEITAFLPYYIQYNKKTNSNNKNHENKSTILSRRLFKEGNNGEYYKYIFPILMAFGFYYLQKTIANNFLYLFIILIFCIGIQIYNQKQFVQSSHEESPFQILFKTYLNFAVISLISILSYEIVFNGFHIRNLFYWLTDLKIFLSCLIGFGICGAICYNMFIIFMRICLSNNIIVKLIKYINLIIIDLVGVFLFRQYIIASYLDYIVGLSLCGISMMLLDFHNII